MHDKLNKVLMFYFPSVATYWDTITICQIENKVTTLGRYYLNFDTKYFYPGKFNEEGIPLYNLNLKEIFQPTVICQYALGVFEQLYKKDFKDHNLQTQFITQAEWLLKNQIKLVRGSGWNLNFNVQEYGLKQPWISAITQGEAISVLTRAYLISGKNIYLDAAESAVIPFQYDVINGGLRNYFNKILIYEEYPSKSTNAVLNGFIFSLFGLFDLYLSTEKSYVKKMFEEGIESVIKLIKYYDTGYWSKYNLYNYPGKYLASYKYHRLHIEQLKALYMITSEKLFYDYHIKWKSYDEDILKKTKALVFKLFS